MMKLYLCPLTSYFYISGNRHAVYLGLDGTRILPSMPQLNVPDHDVSSQALFMRKSEGINKANNQST